MQIRPVPLVLLAAALVGAGLLATRMLSPAEGAVQLRPDDRQLIARGAQVYQAECASCHGARLEGQPRWRERGPDGLLPAPPHDRTGHTWHHPDEVLFRITKYGVAKAANLPDHRSAMPAYEGKLSDEDIVAVLSWIKAQWPPAVRKAHDDVNARARRSQGG